MFIGVRPCDPCGAVLQGACQARKARANLLNERRIYGGRPDAAEVSGLVRAGHRTHWPDTARVHLRGQLPPVRHGRCTAQVTATLALGADTHAVSLSLTEETTRMASRRTPSSFRFDAPESPCRRSPEPPKPNPLPSPNR